MARKSNRELILEAKKRLEDEGYEIINPNSFKCTQCGEQKLIKGQANWYASNNRDLYSECSVIPLCRNCMEKLWNSLVIDSKGDEKLGTYRFLQEIRIPWIESLWDIARNSKQGTVWGIYIGKYNSLPQYKKSNMSDTESFKGVEISFEVENSSENKKMSKKKLSIAEEKWGYGYKSEEYLNFDRKYNKMHMGYNEKTSLHTERFLTYIIHKVKEEMATAKGEVNEAEKWGKMATSDAEKAKLNISQLSKSDLTNGIDVLPQLIEAVEERMSLIPLMPKLKTIPYDDCDMIIYGYVNYGRRLAELPPIEYKDVWGFYDNMIDEHFRDQKYSEEEIEKIKSDRNNKFKDLGNQYFEPLYSDHHQEPDNEEDEEDGEL